LWLPFTTSIPCNTANFDNYDDCFIEQWLTDEYGAFAAIGNTRYGWGSYDGGTSGFWDGLNASSHYLLSQFLDAYFNSSEGYNRIGDCLFDSRELKMKDRILSQGEMFSTTLLECYLNSQNIKAKP